MESLSRNPKWTQAFAMYATVSGCFSDPDIDFDVYQPVLANELTSLIEESVNFNYRAEPPLCGSCAEEGGHG
jgi:hypothetical protein